MLNTEERLFLLSIITEKIEKIITEFGFESNKNKKKKNQSQMYTEYSFVCEIQSQENNYFMQYI